jgi:Putative auto-transporter adhesin, head GIN domain
MKKLLLSLLLVSVFYNLLAQKTINDPNAEKRNVIGFHGINVGTGIKLILTEGAAEEVAVSADKTEYRDKIVTKIENGVLKIYYNSKLGAINTRKEKKELKAYVSYKTLDQLNANTGAEVQIEGTLKSASMKMNVNTGATIKGTINVNDLDVDQNTGSVVTLTGDAGKLDVEGDTGSMFKGIDLKTNNCSVTASTGAGVYITVQKELNVKANTGGYVKYKGDAGIREIKTNTGGSVSKI